MTTAGQRRIPAGRFRTRRLSCAAVVSAGVALVALLAPAAPAAAGTIPVCGGVRGDDLQVCVLAVGMAGTLPVPWLRVTGTGTDAGWVTNVIGQQTTNPYGLAVTSTPNAAGWLTGRVPVHMSATISPFGTNASAGAEVIDQVRGRSYRTRRTYSTVEAHVVPGPPTGPTTRGPATLSFLTFDAGAQVARCYQHGKTRSPDVDCGIWDTTTLTSMTSETGRRPGAPAPIGTTTTSIVPVAWTRSNAVLGRSATVRDRAAGTVTVTITSLGALTPHWTINTAVPGRIAAVATGNAKLAGGHVTFSS